MHQTPRADIDTKDHAPLFSVVIVAYRNAATLAECLDSLAAQTERDFETILLDNACPDHSAAAARTYPAARVIVSNVNLGFAAGNNFAARVARGQWLVLLNPDAFPAPDWLAALRAAMRRYPRVRVLTSVQLDARHPGLFDGIGDAMTCAGIPYRGGYRTPCRPVPEGEVFSPCGAAMAIDRALFLAMGGFDERYFCYCEDVDLGYRLRLAGEPTILVAQARVRHWGGASSGERSPFAVFHGTRNRLWTFAKCTPAPLLWLTAPLHLALTVLLLLRERSPATRAAAWRGFGAGLAGLPAMLAARRTVQAERRATNWAILRMMTLNPASFWGRRGKIVPIATCDGDAAPS